MHTWLGMKSMAPVELAWGWGPGKQEGEHITRAKSIQLCREGSTNFFLERKKCLSWTEILSNFSLEQAHELPERWQSPWKQWQARLNTEAQSHQRDCKDSGGCMDVRMERSSSTPFSCPCAQDKSKIYFHKASSQTATAASSSHICTAQQHLPLKGIFSAPTKTNGHQMELHKPPQWWESEGAFTCWTHSPYLPSGGFLADSFEAAHPLPEAEAWTGEITHPTQHSHFWVSFESGLLNW